MRYTEIFEVRNELREIIIYEIIMPDTIDIAPETANIIIRLENSEILIFLYIQPNNGYNLYLSLSIECICENKAVIANTKNILITSKNKPITESIL